jgi:hypothetical protein
MNGQTLSRERLVVVQRVAARLEVAASSAEDNATVLGTPDCTESEAAQIRGIVGELDELLRPSVVVLTGARAQASEVQP